MSRSHNLPGLLDRGIYLEDSDVLLDWNSSRELLRQLATPRETEEPGNRLGLVWRNRRWLNGMTATFFASLKESEHLRRIELVPQPGKGTADEFQRISRHLALHLGSATRSADRQGSCSRFWQQDEVQIALSLNSRADRIECLISYHGPVVVTQEERRWDEGSLDRHLAKLGLSLYQWHTLKDYLLDLQAGIATEPPAGLGGHQVVLLALRYVETRDRSQLDRAAAILTGNGGSAWLILDKS